MDDVSNYFDRIAQLAKAERIRQYFLHFQDTAQYYQPKFGYVIASEEHGEVAKAILEKKPKDIFKESIQVIAVYFAMLEGMLERGEVQIDV